MPMAKCPSCPTVIHQDTDDIIVINDTKLPEFILLIFCSNCTRKWYHCSICNNIRKHLRTPKQLKRHIKKYHQQPKLHSPLSIRNIRQSNRQSKVIHDIPGMCPPKLTLLIFLFIVCCQSYIIP